MATETSLAVRYYNIVLIGLDILYESARLDPGAIEDLGNIAREIVECTGNRTRKFSPRTMNELRKEAAAEGRKKRKRGKS